jgi:hypothetical protein
MERRFCNSVEECPLAFDFRQVQLVYFWGIVFVVFAAGCFLWVEKKTCIGI